MPMCEPGAPSVNGYLVGCRDDVEQRRHLHFFGESGRDRKGRIAGRSQPAAGAYRNVVEQYPGAEIVPWTWLGATEDACAIRSPGWRPGG